MSLTAYERDYTRRIIRELAAREMESLRLYEPLPEQDRFHRSTKSIRLLRGSNRAGKTLPTAVEVSRCLTNQDPYNKYPSYGRAIFVATNQRELSKVMFRKLTRSGAFKIIKDPETKTWRNFRPWNPWDADHEALARPAPPLIPDRFIKSISYVKKKEQVPSSMTLTTGWEVIFVTSEATPLKGADVSLVWFDEEVIESTWFEEMQSRLFDLKGKFVWSFTPEGATEQLYRVHERAVAGDPEVEEFVIRLRDSPYFSQERIDALARGISPKLRRAKIDGEYLLESYLVFPEFCDALHVIPAFAVPDDWTRWMAVDPGTQICAVEFLAIPPPDSAVQQRAYIYDELYIERCSAKIFAEQVAHKLGTSKFEGFLIDSHSGRVQEVGSGKTIQQQYAEALEDKGIYCNRSGANFAYGSSDVTGGLEAIRHWLEPADIGYPRLAVMDNKCPSLIHELRHYHYKKRGSGFKDMPEDKNDHAIWCLRAFAALDPPYIKPRRREVYSPAYEAWKRSLKQKDENLSIQCGLPI